MTRNDGILRLSGRVACLRVFVDGPVDAEQEEHEIEDDHDTK